MADDTHAQGPQPPSSASKLELEEEAEALVCGLASQAGLPAAPASITHERSSTSSSSTSTPVASVSVAPPSRAANEVETNPAPSALPPTADLSALSDRPPSSLVPSRSALGTPDLAKPSSQRRPSTGDSQQMRPPASGATLHPRPHARAASSTASGTVTRRAGEGTRQAGALPKFIRDPVLVTARSWSDSIPVVATPGLYSYMAPIHGQPPPPLKAHTATLIRNKIWVIGGSVSGSGGCFRGVATFSVDSMRWSVVRGISGTPPPPIRAHTATAVGDAIFCFGGGDGSDYYNDVYKLNTVTLTWSMPAIKARPATAGVPSRRGSAVPEKPPRRRAHSAALWGTHKIVVFGGGNGDKALNDTWIYDCLSSHWEKVECRPSGVSPGDERQQIMLPPDRGYHSCVVTPDDKLIVCGGSDGTKSFSSLDVLDLKSRVWHRLDRTLAGAPVSRAFHSTVLVGHQLLLIGGHDGKAYAKDILAFDLRRKRWTSKKVNGKLPSPERGYHSSTLADGRLFIFGGSDGTSSLGDVWCIELGTTAAFVQEANVSLDLSG